MTNHLDVRTKRWDIESSTLRVVMQVDGLLRSSTDHRFHTEIVWDYAANDDGTHLSKVLWADRSSSLEQAVRRYTRQLKKFADLDRAGELSIALDWGIVPINTKQQADLDESWHVTVSGGRGAHRYSHKAYEKVCLACGQPFIATRRDVRYCSRTCSSRSSRGRKIA